MGAGLQLRAEDAEDLAVLSSCLQDALVPISDMRYERSSRRFVLAVNRFRWEGCEGAERDANAVFERIACGVTIEGVATVTLRGIDQGRRERMLELLAIVTGEAAAARVGPPRAGASTVLLVFAGGGTIRLEADGIRCRLEDFGNAWPTRWRPRHRLETQDG